MIKKANDFVLGILTLSISAFLFFGEVTTNLPNSSQGGPLARADIWLQMIAVLLAIVSLVLVVSSLDFRKSAERESFHFILDSTILLTVAALIAYAILLPIIGFFISTFLMVGFLTMLYTIKEEQKTLKDLTKADIKRMVKKSILTAVILLVILWLVFAKFLAIQLP